MDEKQRKIVAGALVAAGGLGLAFGIDFDAAAQGELVDAVDGLYAAGAALLAVVAGLVLKFKGK